MKIEKIDNFKIIKIMESKNSISFNFFSKDEKWILEIFPKAKHSLFILKNYFLVKRKKSFLLKNWLTLNQE